LSGNLLGNGPWKTVCPIAFVLGCWKNTLSSGATCWLVSACWNDSIFLPSLAKVRPLKDISRLLSGGPTAWEANDEFSSRRSLFNRVFPIIPGTGDIRTRA